MNKKVQLYSSGSGASSSAPVKPYRPVETIDEVPPYELVELHPGKNTIRFSIPVPVYSACPFLPGITDGHRRFHRCGYARVGSTTDRGPLTLPLPPSMPPSSRFIIKYGVRAVARRQGLFRPNKTSMRVVNMAPVSLVRDYDDRLLGSNFTTQMNMLSARSSKLPDSYFVPGALPRASAFRKLMTLGSKDSMYVGVPINVNLEILPHAKIVQNVPFAIKLNLEIGVDDISRIKGIINELELTSIKVTVRSVTDGTAGTLAVVSDPRLYPILDERKESISLRQVTSSEGPPQYIVNCEKLKSLVVYSDRSQPTFVIKSMQLQHYLRIEMGLCINGGSEKRIDVERDIMITSGNDFDAESMEILPPAYDFSQTEQNQTEENNDQSDEDSSDWDQDIKEDFFAD